MKEIVIAALIAASLAGCAGTNLRNSFDEANAHSLIHIPIAPASSSTPSEQSDYHLTQSQPVNEAPKPAPAPAKPISTEGYYYALTCAEFRQMGPQQAQALMSENNPKTKALVRECVNRGLL